MATKTAGGFALKLPCSAAGYQWTGTRMKPGRVPGFRGQGLGFQFKSSVMGAVVEVSTR